jgi:Fur family ferric uptake transcriptional regulator
MVQSSEAVEVAEIQDTLRAAGLRCTSARIAVMQRLKRTSSPITHAELAEELVPKGLDKATVYRNLMDLAEADLVSRTELGDHVWRFELRDQSHDATHPHFVCVDCGSVTCLADVEFNQATQKRASKIGRITEILLKGHCNNCG